MIHTHTYEEYINNGSYIPRKHERATLMIGEVLSTPGFLIIYQMTSLVVRTLFLKYNWPEKNWHHQNKILAPPCPQDDSIIIPGYYS